MATVTTSTFSGNSGGILNWVGTLTVTNSTFYDNRATDGGGIASSDVGSVTVINSTFSNNSADEGEGGTIYNDGGVLTVTNTIVANSTLGSNCAGTITDGGHNIDDGTSCSFSTANGSLSNTDPKLDAHGLQDNGGPTLSIALLTGSPAINAGDESVCAASPVNGIDQRGYVRPGTGSTACSIGAYEYNSPGPPPLCPGDCGADGRVTIEELVTLVDVVLGTAQPSACPHGIPNGVEVTVAFVIRAVNAALNGCTDPAAACVASGGQVTEVECFCSGTPDFFNTCGLGACSCGPTGEPRRLDACDCGSGKCWDGSTCVVRVGP